MAKGNISVHTENIFPIIKKWLYSDKDIFLRELVSNGVDAISKLKKITLAGDADVDEQNYNVKVILNKEEKTIKVIDNGIGMTGEELEKYITQVAFSGAEEFLEKYKGKEGEQIIGHFGLGFYSSFMVSDKVTIDTLSYQNGAEGVFWSCDGGVSYDMEASDRNVRGTEITMHISEDGKEFLDDLKLREILNKYCGFLPYPIYFEEIQEESKDEKKADKTADGDDIVTVEEPEVINDTQPLWLKKPADCTDEEYKSFYHKVFMDYNEPLFWIHLNVDYPFNLKGILYFPKLKHEFETVEGQIKLFNNQVFVAENIKEVIPEFLLLLKGCIDCPDLPLNVSRSFLQNDGYVRKVAQHITRKVSDKLKELYDNNREDYEKYWDDISPFVKYGCMRDEKFYDRVKDILIVKDINDKYHTLTQYAADHDNKFVYVSDIKQQASYVNMLKEHDLNAVVFAHLIDTHFISFVEMKNSDMKFMRIDSDISEMLKDENDTDAGFKDKDLISLFKKHIGDKTIKVEGLKTVQTPAVITISEQSRRMQEMSRAFGGMDMSMFPQETTLVLNKNNELIKSIVKLKKNKEICELLCNQVYGLALMNQGELEPQAFSDFNARSVEIMEKLAKTNLD